MFSIFKRKTREPPEQEVPVFIPPKCPHTWKDFPWYMTWEWITYGVGQQNGELNLKISEPYICVHCKERKDVDLLKLTKTNISLQKANDISDEYEKRYKDKLKPIPVLEDMINDYILVDREKLEIVEKLRNCGGVKIDE